MIASPDAPFVAGVAFVCRRDTAVTKSSSPPLHVTRYKKLSLSAKRHAFQQRPSSLTGSPPRAHPERHAACQGHITHQSHALAPKTTTPTTRIPPPLKTTTHLQHPHQHRYNTKHRCTRFTTPTTLHLKNPQFAPKSPLTQATRDCRRPLTDCDTAHKPLYYAPTKSAQLQTLGNKHLTYGFLSGRNGKLCAAFAKRGL
jgi:hypothetical protein